MTDEFIDKTEPPTPRKLADARKKGFVAKSQDFTIGILLITNVLVVMFSSGYMYHRLHDIMQSLLGNLYYKFADPEIVIFWMREGLFQILLLLAPMLIGVMLVGTVTNLLQVGFVFSLYPIAPKWKKLNIFSGSNYKKYFSVQTAIKLLMGQLRFLLVVVASWIIVGKDMFYIYTLTKGSPLDILLFIFHKSLQVGLFLALSFTVIALIDVFYGRWKFMKEMRMSKRELRDEMKQLEGDLQMKSKIHSLMHSISYNTIALNIPKANLIITEKTKAQSIALMYYPSKMNAPLCIGKGMRQKAGDILNLAHQHQIPVIENSHLAKTLYASTRIGQYIPINFYQDVANAYKDAQRKKISDALHNSKFTSIHK